MKNPALWLLGALLLANLVVFFVYGFDKRRARRGGSRISEKALIFLALPGTLPGALLGMKVFRHKTKKRSFQWKLLLPVLSNAALVYLAWWILAETSRG
ncbi:MAG TPA: DUF1294 domain-containing protein [Planctomycetes bacterium]|nr:DUF1294 domain-containing protein [Planctomycetota bacterium]